MLIGTTSNYQASRQDILTTGYSALLYTFPMTSPAGNVVSNYLDLIAPQHKDQPKFETTVEYLTQPLCDFQTFTLHLPQDFDLDEAIGVQLDIDGEWIGRTRFITTPIANLFFSFDDSVRGFDKGIWKGPFDDETSIVRLDDETYRSLLYAKIVVNNWNGRSESIVETFDDFFTDPATKLFVEDRQDMSMVFGVSQKIPSVLLLVLWSGGYLPMKPGGVAAHYRVVSVDNKPMFGFDMNNDYIAGFNTGVWGVETDWIVQHAPLTE